MAATVALTDKFDETVTLTPVKKAVVKVPGAPRGIKKASRFVTRPKVSLRNYGYSMKNSADLRKQAIMRAMETRGVTSVVEHIQDLIKVVNRTNRDVLEEDLKNVM